MNEKARLAIDVFESLVEPKQVVEIGCIRMEQELPSEGYSTLYLAQACRDVRCAFLSVDTNPGHVETARAVLVSHGISNRLRGIKVEVGDGLEVLDNWGLREPCPPIDLLYLDGGGAPGVHLAQLQAAMMFLSDQAIIIVDDCHPHGGNAMGKGTELIPWAEAEGMHVEIRSTFAEYRAAVINPRGKQD